MRRLLGFGVPIALAVVVGVALLTGGDGGGGGADGEGDGGSPTPDVPAGTTLVAGAAEHLVLSPTLVDPVPVPVTVETPDPGATAARISPVVVDGREEAVVWQGGTPLRLEPAGDPPGALALDPLTAVASSTGLVLQLDGVSGRLLPGRYHVAGSVAVGPEGLGRPADSVTFEATEATTVSFSGPALVNRPPEGVTLEGPGEVTLAGDVELTAAERDRRVQQFTFGPGPYRFDLVWVDEHLEVDGRLQGDVEVGAP